MATPRASRTSALPHLLEMDRLPCLATFAPAPAATRADAVEMLNVPVPSPPVPQVSIIKSPFPRAGMMGVAFLRMTAAAPAISSAVSPFIRSPVMKPPI